MVRKSKNELQMNNNNNNVNINKKSKIRYLLLRGENYEKQIALLLQSLSLYARRNAKLRDAGDLIAENLLTISNDEILNPSLKKIVMELSKIIRSIQDYRDSEILYLEDKLFPLISKYGEILQKQREELRSNANKIYDTNKGIGFNWIRSSSSNITMNQQQQSSKSPITTTATTTTTRRKSQSMERLNKQQTSDDNKSQIDKSIQRYEMKKNVGFKKLLLKLILTELRFTMRSFNNLTYMYKHILDDMKPMNDLKYFNEFFHLKKFRFSNNEDSDTDSDSNDEDDDNDDDVEDDDNNNEDSNSDSDSSSNSNSDDNNNNDDDDDKNKDKDKYKDKETQNERNNNNNFSKKKLHTNKSMIINKQQFNDGKKSLLKRFNSTPEIMSSTTAATTTKSNYSTKKLLKKSVKNKKTLDKDKDNDDDDDDSINTEEDDSDDSDDSNYSDDSDDSDKNKKKTNLSKTDTNKKLIKERK